MNRLHVRNILNGLVLVSLLWILPSGTGCADDNAPPKVVDQLKQTYPKLEFQQVFTSPIVGLYEVISGNKVLYFAPATGHMLVGDMWDKEGENLSKARIGKIMGEKLKDLPMDKSIKIGNGKNIVIEITDPDCPYCRKASEFFAKRTDVTRYIFFLPLGMHPRAEEKVHFILSAENPAEAYEDAMSGRYDEGPLPAFKDNGVFESHKAATDLLGLNGTPNFWINGTYLAGANLQAIEKLLTK
jgi:thiol:disulfide interchange protein DsbC